MSDRNGQSYLLSIRVGCSATSFGMRAMDDQAAMAKAKRIVDYYDPNSEASIELLRADGRHVNFGRRAVIRELVKVNVAHRAARGAAA